MIDLRRESGPLSTKETGERVRVVSLDSGHRLAERLTAMGFGPGAWVDVVKNHGQGAMVVAIGPGRLVLGKDLATRIIVR